MQGLFYGLDESLRPFCLVQEVDRWWQPVQRWPHCLTHRLVSGEAGQDDLGDRTIGRVFGQGQARDVSGVTVVDQADVEDGQVDVRSGQKSLSLLQRVGLPHRVAAPFQLLDTGVEEVRIVVSEEDVHGHVPMR